MTLRPNFNKKSKLLFWKRSYVHEAIMYLPLNWRTLQKWQKVQKTQQICSSVTRIILEGVTEVGWWQSFRDPWKTNQDNHFQYSYWLKRLKFNLLSANFTKWSYTQTIRRQFAAELFAAIYCRIVWVCLAILCGWRL